MTRSCPICLHGNSRELTQVESRPLLICAACRHIWWRDFPADQELEAYYRSQYTSAHNQAGLQENQRGYYRTHLQHLASLTGRTEAELAIADYGCSIPILLDEAAKLGFRGVVGVDHGSEVADYARSRGVTICTPDEFGRSAPESLDILRFSHVLEHTTDPVRVVRDALKKVRPGGLIYITQPSFPVLKYGSARVEVKDAVYPEHLHFFSPLSLSILAESAEIRIQQIFTHQNEGVVAAQYSGLLDVEYAERKLAKYKGAGEPAIPALGNYPRFTGENSCLYGVKGSRTA